MSNHLVGNREKRAKVAKGICRVEALSCVERMRWLTNSVTDGNAPRSTSAVASVATAPATAMATRATCSSSRSRELQSMLARPNQRFDQIDPPLRIVAPRIAAPKKYAATQCPASWIALAKRTGFAANSDTRSIAVSPAATIPATTSNGSAGRGSHGRCGAVGAVGVAVDARASARSVVS